MEDKKLCVRLIRAVKARPCLYNFNIVEYSDKDLTERAWDEVAMETGINVYKCKEKWRNMRIVLKRHLRKGVIKRRRKYYLFDYLRFVIPFMKVNNPEIYGQTANVDADMEKYTDDSLPAANENNSNDVSSMSPTSLTCFDAENHLSLIDHTYNNDSLIQNQFEYHIPVHTEQNSRKGRDELMDPKELCNNRKKQEEDAKKAFLMSLLPDLNLMNGQQTRYFKKRALEAVDEILDGNDQSPSRTNCLHNM